MNSDRASESSGAVPRHAPGDFDAHGDWERVSAWLPSVVEALNAAKIGDLVIRHPALRQPDVRLPAIDPSSGWLFVSAGRRVGYGARDQWGSSDADDVLYVGVVGQAMDGTWQGLAGMYVFGDSAGDASGRRRLARLARLLPQEAQWRSAFDLPAELAPSPTWFEERLHGAYRLSTRGVPIPWDAARLRPAAWSPEEAVLIRIGPTQGALHNLLFVDARSHVAPLVEALSEDGNQDGRALVVTMKRGDKMLLRRLAAGANRRVEPSVVTAPTRFHGGWVIDETRHGRAHIRLAKTRLRSRPPHEGRYWHAPRLSAGGIIDWSATVRFTRSLGSGQQR